MFGRHPDHNRPASLARVTDTENRSFPAGVSFPSSGSSLGEIEKMNDDDCAANESEHENGGKREKECGLGQKIPSRFITEIFAADVKKR